MYVCMYIILFIYVVNLC